jgi:hypothetical protein
MYVYRVRDGKSQHPPDTLVRIDEEGNVMFHHSVLLKSELFAGDNVRSGLAVKINEDGRTGRIMGLDVEKDLEDMTDGH